MTVPGARPRVIAHRGASHDLPEHTPAAYRRALEVGADGLECDVRLSADGHLVCVHDARVDRTSSGRGPVSGMRLDQLRSLDWGSWMPDGARSGSAGDSAYGDGDEGGGVDGGGDEGGGDLEPGRRELLSLRELFVLARDCGRPVELAVETKHPNRFGARVEEALVDLLTEFGWQHGGSGVGSGEGAGAAAAAGVRVRMMSFSALAVRRMHRLAPWLELVYLMERVPRVYRDGSLPPGAAVAGLDVAHLRTAPDLVDRLHRAGRRVHVWTVDDPVDVELCLASQVEAIITNRPREVLAQVRAAR